MVAFVRCFILDFQFGTFGNELLAAGVRCSAVWPSL